MSITPYCSRDEVAKKRGYADWDAYALKNPFPTEAGADDMLEECTQIINEEIGRASTNNITDEEHTTYLRNLCYRMFCLMEDEELGRAHERMRSQYVPKDYLYARDRTKLHRIGLENSSRVVGQVG